MGANAYPPAAAVPSDVPAASGATATLAAPRPAARHLTTPAEGAAPQGILIDEQQMTIPPDLRPVEGATIIARVGGSVVLEREVLAFVNSVLAENRDRIPPEQIEEVRLQLIRQRLKPLIETKMVVEDVRRQLPEENLKSLEETLSGEFEKKEVKRMLKRMKVQTRPELEARLAEMGSSLEREKQAFIERTIAQSWIRQQLQIDSDVTHDEMLERYHENIDRFRYPAKARWQELMVRFDEFDTKADAYRAIAEMGNRVMAGEPFEDVARRFSQGATAEEGGVWDWTSKGSLVSDVLDEALFTLPVGRLSRILETDEGFHIIRVIERREAGVVPFVEAQVELRDEIRKERFKQATERYLKELRERIPVWTIFDDEDDKSEDSDAGNAHDANGAARASGS